jgi:hypothetical protein
MSLFSNSLSSQVFALPFPVAPCRSRRHGSEDKPRLTNRWRYEKLKNALVANVYRVSAALALQRTGNAKVDKLRG